VRQTNVDRIRARRRTVMDSVRSARRPTAAHRAENPERVLTEGATADIGIALGRVSRVRAVTRTVSGVDRRSRHRVRSSICISRSWAAARMADHAAATADTGARDQAMAEVRGRVTAADRIQLRATMRRAVEDIRAEVVVVMPVAAEVTAEAAIDKSKMLRQQVEGMKLL
jgi:hypothetical protein